MERDRFPHCGDCFITVDGQATLSEDVHLSRKVAAFVSVCLDYRRFEASDLLPYATREKLEELGLVGYQIDTFSSDYDDYIDESGMVYDAHGA